MILMNLILKVSSYSFPIYDTVLNFLNLLGGKKYLHGPLSPAKLPLNKQKIAQESWIMLEFGEG